MGEKNNDKRQSDPIDLGHLKAEIERLQQENLNSKRTKATFAAKNTTRQFNHLEAFKVMEYRCDKCGQSEMIWNSRDGVTPMFLSCAICGEQSAHVNWKGDTFAPEHTPKPGERVFINMPDELRLPTARARMASFDGTKYEEKDPKQRQIIIRDISKSFPQGSPWLIVWPGRKSK